MKFYTLLLNKYETLTMSAHNFFRTAKLFGIIFVPSKNLEKFDYNPRNTKWSKEISSLDDSKLERLSFDE